jgi:thiamine biosynthesis lipoprotein
VAAKTCVDANVASTASFLLEDAPAWLEARRLPARLVSVDGKSTVVAGWPEDERPRESTTTERSKPRC